MSFSFDALPPVATGATLGVRQIATVPASGPGAPTARIQQIEPVPGSPGVHAVLDTRGVVRLYQPDGSGDADGDGFRDTPLIDLREAGIGFTEPGPESGLRSIAFHPDFAASGAPGEGRFYLAYSATTASADPGTRLFRYDRDTRAIDPVFHDAVTEFTVSDPSAPLADPTAGRPLLRIEQPFGNHNFGQFRFDGADLYLGIGDGGGAGDPLGAAQRLDQIFGKILRIDPLGGGATTAYGIPESNPFLGTEGALPEIYAHGLRNPQQISVDRLGRILASDIGQGTIEEINVILPGGNYGWDLREGTFATAGTAVDDLPASDAPLTLQYPLTQYDHEETRLNNAAVGGGLVYRGDDLPALHGTYIFTDFPGGELFFTSLGKLATALEDDHIDPTETRAPLRIELRDATGAATDFGTLAGNPFAGDRVDLRLAEGDDGALWAISKTNGAIYEFTVIPADDRVILGTPTDDTLLGGRDDDVIRGFAGNDVLKGLGLHDTIRGGAGDDTLIGGPSGDKLMGDAGNDLIRGGTGLDRIWGSGGADTILGGAGRDRLTHYEIPDSAGAFSSLPGIAYGQRGDDDLSSGRIGGGDTLIGGAGDDRLAASDSNLVVRGGQGDDRIEVHVRYTGTSGDLGILNGGAGSDTLEFLIPRSDIRTGTELRKRGIDIVDNGRMTLEGADGDTTLRFGSVPRNIEEVAGKFSNDFFYFHNDTEEVLRGGGNIGAPRSVPFLTPDMPGQKRLPGVRAEGDIIGLPGMPDAFEFSGRPNSFDVIASDGAATDRLLSIEYLYFYTDGFDSPGQLIATSDLDFI